MSLSSPAVLVAGLVVLAGLVVAARTLSRRRTAALATVLAPGRRSRQVGLWLTVGGVAVLTVAAAGPTASLPVPRSTGTLVVAVDVSNSMAAQDARPTRLAVAQRAARTLVASQPDGVKVGVVAFENGALTTARPATDHSAAIAAIDRLRVTGGTSLGDAILTALSAVIGRPVQLDRDGSPRTDLGYWRSATIVLISDGEDEAPDAHTNAAAAAAQAAGIHVETIGVGTADGATVDVDGYRLHTALDQDTLTRIARTTGGSYHADSGNAVSGVGELVHRRLEVADRTVPLAGAFTGVALVLLVAGGVMTVRRTGRVI